MIFDFLSRWRNVRLDKEMSEFRDRSVANFPKITGEPKFPAVQVEYTFVCARKFSDEEVQPTIETPVSDVLGPPAPRVDSVVNIDNLGSGPAGAVGTVGGDKISVRGDNFRKGDNGEVPTIKIGNVAATEVVWISNQELQCRVPSHSQGFWSIVVTLSTGQESNDDVQVQYLPRPGVNSITPNSGPVGTRTVIAGYNFGVAGKSNAFIATVKISEFNKDSSTFDPATIPGVVNGSGYDVKVVNQYGMQGILYHGFSVTDTPPPPPPPPPGGTGPDRFDFVSSGITPWGWRQMEVKPIYVRAIKNNVLMTSYVGQVIWSYHPYPNSAGTVFVAFAIIQDPAVGGISRCNVQAALTGTSGGTTTGSFDLIVTDQATGVSSTQPLCGVSNF